MSAARWPRRTLLRMGTLIAGATLVPAARSRAQSIGNVMATLSDYMAAARERPLPSEVIEHAKHHVLDTVAAMVSGSALPPGHAALRFAATQTPGGTSTVIGADFSLDPSDAALVNGTWRTPTKPTTRTAPRNRTRAPLSCRRPSRSARAGESTARDS